ncbi:MAG TPA: histidine kinase dimerization/phospho-acceptor domain-containing protein [Candidatus Acidoferrales bacterium]|nr:histidine kinase dimerization/phospho-acceptor domain-containing protein [Candidatus Acidoferrales bacterium]
MKPDGVIAIVCANRRLASEYCAEFRRPKQRLHICELTDIPVREQLRERVSAFLLDESAVKGRAKKALKNAVERLVTIAPVTVVAAANRQSDLAGLLTAGLSDFVARTGGFVTLAAGLVKLRLGSNRSGKQRSLNELNNWSNFGEMLRHEVNNPLTGILGNAEMLLARRDQLPAPAIERLETIAHLAVRLRETIRQLSGIASQTVMTSIRPSKTSSDSEQNVFALKKPYGHPQGGRSIDAG